MKTDGELNNYFLTEFNSSSAKSWGFYLALFSMIGALGTLLLGHLCHSNGLYVRLIPLLKAHSEGFISSLPWWKGYLADANHGISFVIIAPCCYLAVWLSLTRAHESLATLYSKQIISKSTLDKIGEINKQLFLIPIPIIDSLRVKPKRFRGLPILFLLICSFISLNLIREFGSRETSIEVRDGSVRSVGYTQRPYFSAFNIRFATLSGNEQLKLIKDLELCTRLKSIVIEKVLQEGSSSSNDWAPYLSVAGKPLSGEDAVQRHKLNERVDVNWEEVLNANPPLLTIKMSTNSMPLTPFEHHVHTLFVFCLCVLEGTLHAIGIWALLKAVFWLLVVWKLLPPKGGEVWKLLLEDTEVWKLLPQGQEERICKVLGKTLLLFVLISPALYVLTEAVSGKPVSEVVSKSLAYVFVIVVGILLSRYITSKFIPFNDDDKATADFGDPEKSYGMKSLYPAYNSFLYVLILAGFLLIAQKLNTSNSGLMIGWQASSQMFTFLTTTICIAIGLLAIFMGPIILFARRMNRLKQIEICKLENEASILKVENRDQQTFAEKIELAKLQQTWPKDDKQFLYALSLATYIFIVPYVANLMTIIKMEEVSNILNVHQLLKSKLDESCESIYGNQKPILEFNNKYRTNQFANAPNNSGNLNVVAAKRIESSSKIASDNARTKSDAELKNAISELTSLVNSKLEQLDSDSQEQLANRLCSFLQSISEKKFDKVYIADCARLLVMHSSTHESLKPVVSVVERITKLLGVGGP